MRRPDPEQLLQRSLPPPGRRGKKRAQLAVAHSLLVIIYYLLRDGTAYQDLSASHFDERDRNMIQRRGVRSLERHGYRVSLENAA